MQVACKFHNIMISQHSDICSVEKNFGKKWNSETWPSHLPNQSEERKSSRKRESHLGKNDKSTRPVRLRSLIPELFEMPSDEEEAGNANHGEDDLCSDVSTMLLVTSSNEDFPKESLESSYTGTGVMTPVNIDLGIVSEEVKETLAAVTTSGRKCSNTGQSASTSSFGKLCSRTLNTSRFAQELKELDVPSENKLLQSLFVKSSNGVESNVKVNDCAGSVNSLCQEKPVMFKEPRAKVDVLVKLDTDRRVLRDIGCSPFFNSVRSEPKWNGAFHTAADKENIHCNSAWKVSEKTVLCKSWLKNEVLDIETNVDTYRIPVGQNLDICSNNMHSNKFSHQLKPDFSSVKKCDTFTPGCKHCLRKLEMDDKSVQCESENFDESRSELHDKAVQCVLENADKNLNIDLKVKSKEKSEHTLVVKGKHYNVLNEFGHGGSSVVYQVLEPNTLALFAVKCVRLPVGQETVARDYINEINLLQQLQDSDCVIALHDFEHVPEKEILYVVMEKGETDLSNLIRDSSKKRKTLSVPMIVYYWTEMLNAVKCIHDHGIIHSDLKPANFLLVSGRLKLIDFGIASAVQSDMTSVFRDSMSGTLNYMSPEAVTCCNNSSHSSKYKVSYRSDVWSLGCILYSLIYGRTPFQHIENMHMKIAAITNPSYQISFSMDRRCPQILLKTLKWCLTFDPKKRPTIAQLLAVPYISDVSRK